MIPCITSKDINYLYGTADERYNFSSDFFRKTHFPQTLNRYYQNKLLESVTEDELLQELEADHSFGNRVYVIFGSTGSGKSELLCWIRDKWQVTNNPRPIIRISRSELNPQVLVKKCYDSIGIELGELVIDENKWDLLVSKPITIINQMVWSTMSELFDSDEDIVPASLLLRPVIEKNILEFTQQIRNGQISKPLEIITKEQYELLLESTAIKIEIHYNKFRNSLLKKLDQFLFQGTDIKTIFKQLSKKLIEKKIRPVLLIDDLVQSINLYAADLLDYFITLEEGNWDVVIGLTPGVEQVGDFNAELMNRIKNLDTIDDRVKKLWLSDEAGSNFFTLEKQHAQEYLKNYLLALKETNGFTCSEHCLHASSCKNILSNEHNHLEILPFNLPLINRIYDGIPNGKGALRYLILHSRELLQFIIRGDRKAVNKVLNLINREIFIEHDDKTIKFLAEMYAKPEEDEYIVSTSLLNHFKYDSNDIKLTVRNLEIYKEEGINVPEKKNVGNSHVRDWIEGKKVKEELLEPVRTGVAALIQEVVKGTSLVRQNTSRAIKSTAAIQRSEIVNRYKYPISFTENQTTQIVIEKRINLLQLAKFQQLKMQDRGDMFATFANDYNVSEWIYQSEQLKTQWLKEFEESLCFPLADFAYYFKQLLSSIHLIAESEWTSSIRNPIKKEWIEISEELFLDWFALRDNIIDVNLMANMTKTYEFEQKFLTFKPSKLLNKFHIKNYPILTFIDDIQKAVNDYLNSLEPLTTETAADIQTLIRFSRYFSSDMVENIQLVNMLIQKENRTIDDYKRINDIVTWLSNEENSEVINKIRSEQTYLLNINKFIPFGDDHIDNFEDYLRDKLNLRSQVRRHLLKLLENGETQLPKKQWKGILRDIEEINPDFFEHLHVKINIRK